jgi:hypothetical protein
MLIERRIVGKLIDQAIEEGWELDSVYDGEDYCSVGEKDKNTALEYVFSVDESTLRFRKPTCDLRGVFIVLGNGIDVLSDWSEPEDDDEDFSGLLERVCAWIDDEGYVV